jgi:hypothetical protein
MITTVVTLVCIVAHQIGVVRAVPASQIIDYPNAVVFPCSLDDNQALDYYNREIYRQQQQECPGCFPWKAPPDAVTDRERNIAACFREAPAFQHERWLERCLKQAR